MTSRQRDAIEAVIGLDASAELVLAIRDARGRTFQRLEFLGDPLLESIEAMVSVIDEHRSSDHRATTDAWLATQVSALGVGEWLEWDPSDQRSADLVEAIAGAAFLTGGWPQVGIVYSRVASALPPAVAELLTHAAQEIAPPISTERIERPLATLGSSMLETAATVSVYAADETGDEGTLSNLRRDLHQTRVVAAWAEGQGLAHPSRVIAMTSDVIETWLGEVALSAGPATAVTLATTVLTDGLALVPPDEPPRSGASS